MGDKLIVRVGDSLKEFWYIPKLPWNIVLETSRGGTNMILTFVLLAEFLVLPFSYSFETEIRKWPIGRL